MIERLNEATWEFIRQHRTQRVEDLALKGCRDSQVDLKEALVQIAGWQMARTKLPLWAETEGILFPPHLSMEQCSGLIAARLKRWAIGQTMREEALLRKEETHPGEEETNLLKEQSFLKEAVRMREKTHSRKERAEENLSEEAEEKCSKEAEKSEEEFSEKAEEKFSKKSEKSEKRISEEAEENPSEEAERIFSEKIEEKFSEKSEKSENNFSKESEQSEEAEEYALSERLNRLTDLTGGFGVDFASLAPLFRQATYVERQEHLCQLAAHNFPLLGLQQFQIHHGDAEEYLKSMERVDWIFIDPARRGAHGQKVVFIADCEPDVKRLEPLLLEKAEHVLIKLSPMLDITQALRDLPHAQRCYILSVDGECKEMLIVLGDRKAASPDEVEMVCEVVRKGKVSCRVALTKRMEEECLPRYAEEPLHYLYEPDASLLKAGMFNYITQCYPVAKLHPNSHLYTSKELVPRFPGRTFRITGHGAWSKKGMDSLIPDSRRANITVRNFPLSAEALRKQLKLKEGGRYTLFGTTIGNNRKILIGSEPIL